MFTQNPVSSSQTFTVLSREAETKKAEPAAVTSRPVVDVVVLVLIVWLVDDVDAREGGAGMKQIDEIVWSCPRSVRIQL